MGQNQCNPDTPPNTNIIEVKEPIEKQNKIEIISRNSFDFISIIGRGGFGKVWKVCLKSNQKYYSMKEMNKSKIIDKKSEKGVKGERDLLSKMNHPFIVNMHFSFQDNDNLYLVMDLLTGGDLRFHICRTRFFSEEQSKFFLSCIILGIEYCHSNHIIHRDIKPENLVLDSNGYVHITDFGIAKIQQPNNFKETSGTPGYMSPEVLCSQNHTTVSDYFALGVMGYEFMQGMRPYLGKSRKEIKDKILARQIVISKEEIKEGWSEESADCINKLLQRKPCNRLGLHGASEVKNHPWFINYPWAELYNKVLESPFKPSLENNFDFKYCNEAEIHGDKTEERYNEIFMSANYKLVFQDYLYYNKYQLSLKDRKTIFFINIHEKMYNKKNLTKTNHLIKCDTTNNLRKLVKNNSFDYNANCFGITKKNNNNNNNKIPLPHSMHSKALSEAEFTCNNAFLNAYHYQNQRKSNRRDSNKHQFYIRIKRNSKSMDRTFMFGTITVNKNTNFNLNSLNLKTNNQGGNHQGSTNGTDTNTNVISSNRF